MSCGGIHPLPVFHPASTILERQTKNLLSIPQLLALSASVVIVYNN